MRTVVCELITFSEGAPFISRYKAVDFRGEVYKSLTAVQKIIHWMTAEGGVFGEGAGFREDHL
jgi:hypothetical protein